MKKLLTINQNSFEPQDYTIRKVVRALLLNTDKTQVLFFGSALPGGGVEEGESNEEAVVRECLEEVGAHVQVGRCLGEVVVYRDASRQKYITHAYVCEVIGDLREPTTSDPSEQKTVKSWRSISAAISELFLEIDDIESKSDTDIDTKATRISRRKTTIAFLKEYENQN